MLEVLIIFIPISLGQEQQNETWL